jgi:hypothetical protein
MINSKYLQEINGKKYVGNPFASYYFIKPLVIGIIGAFFILSDNNVGWSPVIIIFMCWLVGYLYFSALMYYFIIKDGKLIIRNHYVPWKKIVIDLNYIAETVMERRYRSPLGLRVITKDSGSKFYPGGSLKEKDWEELLNDLNSLDVQSYRDIRNI